MGLIAVKVEEPLKLLAQEEARLERSCPISEIIEGYRNRPRCRSERTRGIAAFEAGGHQQKISAKILIKLRNEIPISPGFPETLARLARIFEDATMAHRLQNLIDCLSVFLGQSDLTPLPPPPKKKFGSRATRSAR